MSKGERVKETERVGGNRILEGGDLAALSVICSVVGGGEEGQAHSSKRSHKDLDWSA